MKVIRVGLWMVIGGLLGSSYAMAGEVRIGPVGAYTSSKWSLDLEDDFSSFSSFNTTIKHKRVNGSGFGLAAEIDLARGLSLLLEPMSIEKGNKTTVTTQDTLSTYNTTTRTFQNYNVTLNYGSEWRSRYFQLPVLFKYAPLSGRVSPRLIAGPVVGFLTSANVTSRRSYSSDAPADLLSSRYSSFLRADGKEDEVTNEYIGVEAGLLFGAGVQAKVGPGLVFVDALYDLGLTNIDKDLESESAKNGGYEVRAGVVFALPRH